MGPGAEFQRRNPAIVEWIRSTYEPGICFRHRSLWPRADFLSHPEWSSPGHGTTAYCESSLVWEERDLHLDPDGDAEEQPSKITLKLPRDAVISYRTPGGGGYGPAIERDPERVLADVIQGKVSVERAREAYGVVIEGENRAVDMKATLELRGRLKSG